jgi:alpha-D-xyloside xylohydrolase
MLAAVGCWLTAAGQTAGSYERNGNVVTIRPEGGQARVIQLEVVNDNIIRVRATSKDELPNKPKSLMIVPQVQYKGAVEASPQPSPEGKGAGADSGKSEYIDVKVKNVRARVWTTNGRIEFFDGEGKPLLQEAYDRPGEEPGKQFWDFTVPERELGAKGGAAVTEEMKHGLQWQMKFFSPLGSESFYGLGQHRGSGLDQRRKNYHLENVNMEIAIPLFHSVENSFEITVPGMSLPEASFPNSNHLCSMIRVHGTSCPV